MNSTQNHKTIEENEKEEEKSMGKNTDIILNLRNRDYKRFQLKRENIFAIKYEFSRGVHYIVVKNNGIFMITI